MVGITYSDLREGDGCWIAVGNDVHSRIFFEGKFTGYLPDSSLAVLELRAKIPNPSAKGARAVIADLRAQGIEARHGLPYGEEPLCHYAVFPRSGELDQVIEDFNALQRQLAAERCVRR